MARRLESPRLNAEMRAMRAIWSREPWSPKRLLILAVPLAAVWFVSAVVGSPPESTRLVCELGESCTAWDARFALQVTGFFAGLLAVVAVGVAASRWARARRQESRDRSSVGAP
jgi:hypothetical protein